MTSSEFQKAMPLTCQIVDAFTRIEVQDRQVNRIVMPVKAFKILKEEHHLTVPIPSDDMLNFARRTSNGTISGFRRADFTLYGADIVLADQFRVISSGTGYYEISEPVPYRAFMGNLIVHVKSRAEPLFATCPSEDRAIETLREMISESDFRKYLKHAFILVTGASGLVYQIFRTRSHIRVWRQGLVVEELCVRISDPKVPPTDNVIALKTVIECSEEDIRKMANVYKMTA